MKLILSIILLFLFATCYSQTKKGTFVLSGKTDLNFLVSNTTISRDSIEGGKMKNNQYGFTVGFGYFIADNFIIGLSGAHSYIDSKIEQVYVSAIGSQLCALAV